MQISDFGSGSGLSCVSTMNSDHTLYSVVQVAFKNKCVCAKMCVVFLVTVLLEVVAAAGR